MLPKTILSLIFFIQVVQSFPTGETLASSANFMALWKHFDTDSNGYVEKSELTDLLKYLNNGAEMDQEQFDELKSQLLEKYDTDYDGKIGLSEMSILFPVKENMIGQTFTDDHKLASADILQIFDFYDRDSNMYIDSIFELDGFLKDLLSLGQIDIMHPQMIEEYKTFMITQHDENKDGKLSLAEMSTMMPPKDNLLLQMGSQTYTEADIQQIFSFYDRDNNGQIDGTMSKGHYELGGFAYDYLELNGQVTMEGVKLFEAQLLNFFDVNQDENFNFDELLQILQL